MKDFFIHLKEGNPIFFKYNDSSVYILPCVVSMVLSAVLTVSVYLTKSRFGLRACIVSLSITLIWLVLFIIHQRYLLKGKTEALTINCPMVIVIVISVVIAGYLACTIWRGSSLSLDPYGKIDNGSQGLDILFHSAISESFRSSLTPSTLLNDEEYVAYHTFSHMIMGAIAKITSIPGFITYNYLFPIVFLPLYVFGQTVAISAAKRYFVGAWEMSFFDITMVSLFITGMMDNRILVRYAVWKSSYIGSGSFLVANTMLFLSYASIFYALYCRKAKDKNLLLFCVVMIPTELFLVSWAKTSVGLVFTVSVMYYVFRTRMKDIRGWILNAFYLGVFSLSFVLFNSNLSSKAGGGLMKRIKWLAFSEWTSGRLGIWGHYLLLLLIPVAYIWIDILKNKYTWDEIKQGHTIFIEEMVCICIIAFLPGLVMQIEGGSAVYFSYVVEIPAMLLLCGHNYFSIMGGKKRIVYCVIFLWCICMAWTNRSPNPFNCILNEHGSGLSSMLLEIRELGGANPQDYTIYMDKNALPARVFADDRKSVYVCPAMTGIGVINATYIDNGICYLFSGEVAIPEGSGRYGLLCTDSKKPLTLEEALDKASKMDKEYLIHLTRDGYEVISCHK